MTRLNGIASSPERETNFVQLAAGFNLVVNTTENGNNTLAELLPDAVRGTLVFLWDRRVFRYSVAAQFVPGPDGAGQWSNPALHWEPWEAAAVIASPNSGSSLGFVGRSVPNPGRYPADRGAVGLMAVERMPAVENDPLVLDAVALYRFIDGDFKAISTFDPFSNGWNPPLPAFRPREVISLGMIPSPVVYFANYAPGLGMSNVWSLPLGYMPTGGERQARLMLLQSSGFEQLGESVPFATAEAGIGSGFLDPAENLVREVLTTAKTVTLRVEIFDPTRGSRCVGGTPPFDLSLSDGVPTALPTIALSLLEMSIVLDPRDESSSIGASARLSAAVGVGGANYFGSVDWEKLQPDGSWQLYKRTADGDLLNPGTVLAFDPVTSADGGVYRAHIQRDCFDLISKPATLTILSAPAPELKLAIHHALELEFLAEKGAWYQIERSEDLRNWQAHGDALLGTGEMSFRFESLRGAPQTLHYRIKRLP